MMQLPMLPKKGRFNDERDVPTVALDARILILVALAFLGCDKAQAPPKAEAPGP